MRIPAIRLRRTLTIRSLMVVVALVAIGIAGWKAREHWAECSRRGAELRAMVADDRKVLAQMQQDEAKNQPAMSQVYAEQESHLRSLRDKLKRTSPDKARERSEILAEIQTYEQIKAMERKLEEGLQKLTKQFDSRDAAVERLAREYQRAAWRPWVDLRSIRAEDKALEDRLLKIAMAEDPEDEAEYEAEYEEMQALLTKLDQLTDAAFQSSTNPKRDSAVEKAAGTEAPR